jgi:hypothetical protein
MFLVETMDRYIADAVERADPAEGPHYLISAVQHSRPLHGEAIVDRWRALAATYPEALARAAVTKHMAQPARWYYADMLAERDDVVFLHEVIVPVVHSLLGMLLGLNRIYQDHPNFKWLDRLIARMTVAPPDLGMRLRRVYRSPPREGVRELRRLLQETVALVERELPGFDTSEARAWIAGRREAWEPPS